MGPLLMERDIGQTFRAKNCASFESHRVCEGLATWRWSRICPGSGSAAPVCRPPTSHPVAPLDFTTLVSPLGCLKSYVFVMLSHGPRLEPKLVGEQHLGFSRDCGRVCSRRIHGSASIAPGCGRTGRPYWAEWLRQIAYRPRALPRLEDGQSQPGYWPTLGPDYEADVPLDRVGIDALSYRKVLGPPADFHWPPPARFPISSGGRLTVSAPRPPI